MNVKLNRTKDWQKVPLPDKSLMLPGYAGNWEIGKGSGILIYTLKEPNWFRKKMTHLILGWVWHSKK